MDWTCDTRCRVNANYEGMTSWVGASKMYFCFVKHFGTKINKANLRDLIAATGLVFLHKIGLKSLIFWPMWHGNFMEEVENQQGTSSILCQALCIISKPSANSNWSYSPEKPNLSQNWWFFFPLDVKIWQMTVKNNRATRQCYFKMCASFHSHLSIQNGVTVRKRQIWVKIDDFCPVWPWSLTDDLEKQ